MEDGCGWFACAHALAYIYSARDTFCRLSLFGVLVRFVVCIIIIYRSMSCMIIIIITISLTDIHVVIRVIKLSDVRRPCFWGLHG